MALRLIRGKYVICQKPNSADVGVIEDGAVAYNFGRIVALGSYRELYDRYRPEVVSGSVGEVILPGFVNAHHHIGLTPFQLGVPDLPLELWLLARLAMPPVDPYLDTLMSAFEMIESGTTTVHHLQSRIPRPVHEWDHYISEVIRAYHDIGMRVTFSLSIRDQGYIIYGDDETFLARLPSPLAGQIREVIYMQNISAREQVDRFFVDLYALHGKNRKDRVRIQLAPANLHWCSDEALNTIAEYSSQYDVGIHMHLLETPYQRVYAERRCGVSAVEYLHRSNLLCRRLTLGHGVWVTQGDLDYLTEGQVSICHNPSSNLRLRSGVAPVNEFLKRGIPVAIGIDEAGINDDRDMLQEMRMALNLHRTPGHEAVAPNPRDVFRMATQSSAQTTAFKDSIGSLRVGAFADFTLLNWSAVASPYLDPGSDVIDSIVRRAKPSAVSRVIVHGETVFHNGGFTRIDRPAVLKDLREYMSKADPEFVAKWRALVAETMAHVREFYRGWLPGGIGEPFYQFNARD
jgi:5-methylthioadenosine/S-adenosylhomocysteine deaminase